MIAKNAAWNLEALPHFLFMCIIEHCVGSKFPSFNVDLLEHGFLYICKNRMG